MLFNEGLGLALAQRHLGAKVISTAQENRFYNAIISLACELHCSWNQSSGRSLGESVLGLSRNRTERTNYKEDLLDWLGSPLVAVFILEMMRTQQLSSCLCGWVCRKSQSGTEGSRISWRITVLQSLWGGQRSYALI